MKEKEHIELKDMEIYKLSRELSRIGWSVYECLSCQDRKIIGDQFITATDSVGANFVEGYYRFHYLDRIKFCYQSRGSLGEALDEWMELLLERKKVSQDEYARYSRCARTILVKLNNYITSIYRSKDVHKKPET